MTRSLALAIIVLQLEIVALLAFLIVLTARVDTASRSGSNVIPAVGADPAASGNLSGLSGTLQNVLQDGSGEHKAGAAELPALHGEASPATESSVPSPSVATRIPEPLPVARRPVSTRSSMKGVASWFESPGYTAAVPSFHWGMKPYWLTVAANSRSVRALVVSYCQCYVGTSRARIVDLSPAAFLKLAPLSRGVIRVTVTHG